MNTFQENLKVNSVVRIKMYKRDSFPHYWGEDMLEYCQQIQCIESLGKTEIRLYGIEDWWFARADFEKVNTNTPVKKRRSGHGHII